MGGPHGWSAWSDGHPDSWAGGGMVTWAAGRPVQKNAIQSGHGHKNMESRTKPLRAEKNKPCAQSGRVLHPKLSYKHKYIRAP